MPPTRGRGDETDPPDESLQRALALVVELRSEVRELLALVTPGDMATRQRGLGALLPDGTDPDENLRSSRARAIGQLAGDEPRPGAGRER